MRLKLIVLLVFLLVITSASARDPNCNQVCDTATDCDICPSDCPSLSYICCGGIAYNAGAYVCCSGVAYEGHCCSDAECWGGTCQNNHCVLMSQVPFCGDDSCDEDETCTNCCTDCACDNIVCCGGVSYAGDCCGDSECISNECHDHYCAAVETCSDSIKNQDEADVDCGGYCDNCANGKSCVQNSDCISNYCLNNQCSEQPVCNEGDKRSCNASNSCPGNLTCTNNAWTQCVTSLNLCDSNCDGTNDLCSSLQCQACVCIENADCAEKQCMTALCQGTPKTCSYANITGCLDDDGCCPSGCNWRLDSDCNMTDDCSNNTVCLDNDLCTIDVCEGSPKACAHHANTECISGDGCCPQNCTFAADMDCSCSPDWQCQDWYPAECPKEKRQKRECQDSNNCTNRTNVEIKLCTYVSKTPLIGKSASSSVKMLTRRSGGNNTNTSTEESSEQLSAAISRNSLYVIILLAVVGACIVYLMYHEGLLKNIMTIRSRAEARRANLLKRIRLFCRQKQSFIMIKTDLIAEGYTLDEINKGIEEYEHESGK